jgi:tetratricopeptide (TPR) repeat protein
LEAQTSPADQEALAKAEEAINAKDYTRALASLEQLAAKDPKNYRALFDIAYAYTMMGERAKAIEAYRQTLAVRPDLFQANVNLAMLLLEEKQATEAAGLLAPVAAGRPSDAHVQLLLANALAGSGQDTEAAGQYRKVLALDSESPDACLGLGRILARQGQTAEAEQQFARALQLQPGDPATVLEAGRFYEAVGKGEQALRLYTDLAAKQPQNAVVRRRLGELLLHQKRYAEAATELEAAARLAPSPQDDWNLARAYAGAKQPAQAVPLLRKVVAANPGDYDARLLLGETLTALREFASARPELEAAARLRPEVPDAWVDLADVLYLQGDLPGTVQMLDRVAATGRKTAKYYFLRAITLDKLEALDEALESYKQFLAVANGAYPDQEFQARQRIKAINLRLEKGWKRRKR